jgi:UDP-N-acetylenolpyruvoylglucosamine reductase
MTTWDPEQVREACRAHGVQWEDNKPMALLTTYAVGGTARLAVTVRTSDDMQRSKSITCVGDVVSAAGAMLMPVLARRSVQAGRGGLEWCVGIPGTVGGAVRMNAGGHGAEMDDSLLSARVLSLRSGATHVVPKSALGLHFRGSALSAHHIVMSAEFSTSAQDVQKGTAELDNIVAWRREHQPGGRNAGSVFVNPAPGSGSAGALIDQKSMRTLFRRPKPPRQVTLLL